MEILAEHSLGDICARYRIDRTSGVVGLEIFPISARALLVEPRAKLEDVPGSFGNATKARVVDSLVQIKLAGDPAAGAFASGHTMRQSASVSRFSYAGQSVVCGHGETRVETLLQSGDGFEILHSLVHREAASFLEVWTVLTNHSSESLRVEMLSSFSISGISPFAGDDASGRLTTHRFRSLWSAEGRLESRTIESLHLERSWSGAGSFSERFGQVGSMPVRKWFPFVAVEDSVAGVLWGGQLAWAGSWQMEIYRQHDDVCLSGGLADRDFGHWLKTVEPGESLSAPPATLCCVQGSLDDLCDRLTSAQRRAADTHPAVEADLPVIFNEWCTSWGDPHHESVLAIADRLQQTGVRYLVIDAGWFKRAGGCWYLDHGDWNVSSALFPQGMEAVAAAIRARGLIPGLWFEIETCGQTSAAFSLVDHLLQKDGAPVTSNQRRFWDLNDPWVVEYLSVKVIDFLERCGFGYLKVDYNETIGIGCDHPDSLGEGLRLQTLGTYRLFEEIRRRLPHLVIENCASGGHRLEPSMLARSAMSSFSDAHESVEIPIIAANLHRLILPRQSQIWAVLHPTDSDQRMLYSLAATFLGRMCLSGDICHLSDSQWQLVCRAMQVYRQSASVIKDGQSRRFADLSESWRHPCGWQIVRRVSRDGNALLAVLHTFGESPERASIPLPLGDWRMRAHLSANEPQISRGELLFTGLSDFTGALAILDRLSDS